jgi:histidine ammonia-lyase
MSIVTITEEPLALEDLLAVIDGAKVELADSARAMIAASRAVVDRALSRNDAVYGLTTQVGHGKDTRLTEEPIREDLLAIELMLARDLLRVRPTKSVLGAGPDAALRMVEEAITVAEPQPDDVHRTLRKRFAVMQAGGSATNAQSVER